MRNMLLGYSFEPWPNSRALGTAGSVMTIGVINKRKLALKKKNSLRRLQSLDAIQAEPQP